MPTFTKVALGASIVFAASYNEAVEDAFISVRKDYPSVYGWSNHDIVVVQLTDENIARINAEANNA